MSAALLNDFIAEEIQQEEIVGSRNHSYVQSALVAALFNLNKFTVYTELSLDINGKEFKPDIALYSLEQGIDSFSKDILRMTDMPLCAIEILSPRQFIESILDKFQIYFDAGVKSCWLVLPNAQTISVYSDFDSVQSFSKENLYDEKLDLEIALSNIFFFKKYND